MHPNKVFGFFSHDAIIRTKGERLYHPAGANPVMAHTKGFGIANHGLQVHQNNLPKKHELDRDEFPAISRTSKPALNAPVCPQSTLLHLTASFLVNDKECLVEVLPPMRD